MAKLNAAGLLVGLVLAAASGIAAAQQPPARTLVAGQTGHPPSLDDHLTNALSAKHATFHIYETLMTRGEDGRIVTGLAESHAASDDGLVHTFRIRQGVRFHNGKTMTSQDVKSSFERYKRIAIRRDLLAPVAAFETPDPATLVIRLARPQPLFLEDLSQQIVPMSVYPAEDAASEANKNSRVGTGPFRFVEWIADRHIVLERFADYAGDMRAAGTDGYGGRKQALVDRVVIRFIPEPSAMMAALETGEIQVAEAVPTASKATLEKNPDIQLIAVKPAMQHMVYVNPTKPPFDKLEVRRAVQVALDIPEIMAIAHEDNYSLNPGLMWPGRPNYSDAGKEFYNVADPARARKLLAEAGYKGEEIVLTTSSDFKWMVDGATVMAEQLRAIGMTVRMVVSDWPTHTKIRNDRTAYHLSHSGKFFNQWIDSPATYLQEWVGDKPAHFVRDPVLADLVAQMRTLPGFAERKTAFDKAQYRFFEQVVALTLGDRGQLQATRRNVKGFQPSVTMRFWNVSLQ
ncbi:MAG: ABC transporter substrate-binding protein [Alphaproteobacteria bacterium]